MITRRRFVFVGAAGIAAACGGSSFGASVGAEQKFEVTHTDAEWKKLLTPDQFAVLRREATEPGGAGPQLKGHRHTTRKGPGRAPARIE